MKPNFHKAVLNCDNRSTGSTDNFDPKSPVDVRIDEFLFRASIYVCFWSYITVCLFFLKKILVTYILRIVACYMSYCFLFQKMNKRCSLDNINSEEQGNCVSVT
jgi:hypothetical protein